MPYNIQIQKSIQQWQLFALLSSVEILLDISVGSSTHWDGCIAIPSYGRGSKLLTPEMDQNEWFNAAYDSVVQNSET